MKQYTIAACLFHKDENEYLDEWLDCHRALGISKFYIYDNDSLVNPRYTINDSSDVEVIQWPGDYEGRQVAAYEHLFEKTKPTEDWVAIIDTDEFIVLKPGFTLQGLLDYIDFNGGEALGINWLCFGSSGYITKPDNAFCYNRHSELTDPANLHIKSIVRTGLSNYKVWNPHYFGVKTLNENLELISDAFTSEHSSNKLYIRHNLTRSLEEFKKKTTRGAGNLRSDESKTKWNTNQWDNLELRLNKVLWDGL